MVITAGLACGNTHVIIIQLESPVKFNPVRNVRLNKDFMN